MTVARVTSNVIFHVRSAGGVTLDFTTDEAAARNVAKAEGAQLYRVDRVSGVAVMLK